MTAACLNLGSGRLPRRKLDPSPLPPSSPAAPLHAPLHAPRRPTPPMLPLATQLVVWVDSDEQDDPLAVASWEAVEGHKYSLWVSIPDAATVYATFNAPAVSDAATAVAQLDATPGGGERVPKGRLFFASDIVTRADFTQVRLNLTVLRESGAEMYRRLLQIRADGDCEVSVTVTPLSVPAVPLRGYRGAGGGVDPHAPLVEWVLPHDPHDPTSAAGGAGRQGAW